MQGNPSTDYYLNRNIKRADLEEQYTKEQLAEYIKCSKDPVYFIENYVKINSLDEGLVSFKLRGYQRDMIENLSGKRKCIIKTSRQQGKTTTTAAFILWYIFFHPDKTVAILANKAETAREILSRVLLAYESTPFFLQPGARTLNKGSIELGNNSKVLATGTSSSAIRGFSCNLLFLDEFAHVEQADEFFKSTYPTISSGKETKVIITSTPNGLNLFYKLFTDAEKGKNDFTALEYHWWQVPGRDEKWKEEQLGILGEAGFRQEFGNEFLGSSNTLINGDVLRSLVAADPIKETKDEIVNNLPENGAKYAAMIDVSGGVGEDYSTITIIRIDQTPYKICYVWRSNKVSPYELPSKIIPIVSKYNNAYLFVERNALGATVADACHFEYEYENIARTHVRDKKQQLTSGFTKASYGVLMTPSTKKIGCIAMKNLVESNIIKDFTMEQIYELANFIVYRKSWQADKGKNDDLVMNLVMFGWATKQRYFTQLTEGDVASKEKQLKEQDELPFGRLDSSFYDCDEAINDMRWLLGRNSRRKDPEIEFDLDPIISNKNYDLDDDLDDDFDEDE